MKSYKIKKSKEDFKFCKYPKCNKEVHEIGSKYCGKHQRKFENGKGVLIKSVAGVGAIVFSVAVKPLIKRIKL